jgi:CheY-like chemotaxis protein
MLAESEAAQEPAKSTLSSALAANRPAEAIVAEPIRAIPDRVEAFAEPRALEPETALWARPVELAMPSVAEPESRQIDSPRVPEGAEASAPVSPPASLPQASSSEPAQILLVDDSKVVRVKTEKLLLGKGYVVITAVDGIDALSKLDTFKPHLIITDIEMPNLDGFGLVRNVRGNPRTAEIPVIVMTSHVNLHLDIAATEGINGFLPKPFNDQDLLDQVAFLCES